MTSAIDPQSLGRAEFFSLIDALERSATAAGGASGSGLDPRSVRLRHDPALRFAPSDVARVQRGADSERIEVTTAFLGLSGTSGPLPSFLVEEIAQEDDPHPVRRDLLDLFHHRALALLSFSVTQMRPGASLGSPAGRDRWADRLSMLGGAGASRLDVADRIRILPLLATRRRGALGFRAALRTLIGSRVDPERMPAIDIREWTGSRASLASSARTALGKANHAIGRDAVLGSSVPDPGAGVVVEIGPVRQETARRFERNGDLHRMIAELFELFDPSWTELEIELRIDRRELDLSLGSRRSLGRDTWLAGRSAVRRIRTSVAFEHEPTQRREVGGDERVHAHSPSEARREIDPHRQASARAGGRHRDVGPP